jgi:curved DNA-binding protein
MHAEAFEKAKQQQRSGPTSSSGYSRDFGGESDFSDFFESMFGGGGYSSGSSFSGGRQVKFRGQDFNAELRLGLRDVFTTQKQTLTVNGKNIRITIPAGIENGQTIKIKGHGGPGRNGGPNGDLYITFSIINNTPFKRDGSNLYSNVSIDLYTAILGGDITVDTFDGKVKLKVKPGTQNGTQIKLKGKGFPKYKKEGQFGDLYVTYTIKIPQQLTEKEKQLFQQLAALNLNK